MSRDSRPHEFRLVGVEANMMTAFVTVRVICAFCGAKDSVSSSVDEPWYEAVKRLERFGCEDPDAE